eukprot:CAMPEP_0197857326 /NCGR_PEP_ID=MMETSP1438-20131217/30254_1 /TAXON_ID=1461541 /ORGANISM="Pterosperma sp., Strain CCMP1384" /LENGTH=186 /DNA_ID=CAMNT_0043473119 /DNA_START=336 /DNA_END=892 /DNA_ORIENTATION=-
MKTLVFAQLALYATLLIGSSSACEDDNALLADVGAQMGITTCTPELCTGKYQKIARPFCKVTCNTCDVDFTAECADDVDGMVELFGLMGVKRCRAKYCTNFDVTNSLPFDQTRSTYAKVLTLYCMDFCGMCGEFAGQEISWAHLKGEDGHMHWVRQSALAAEDTTSTSETIPEAATPVLAILPPPT